MNMSVAHLTCIRLIPSLAVMYISVMFLSQLTYVTDARCTFPQFLRRSFKGPRYWLTEIVYKKGTTDRQRYINITVTKTDIAASLTTSSQCTQSDTTCNTIQRIYTMECVQELDGKYIVNRKDQVGGPNRRMCYKFQRINANVVQIRSSEAGGTGICGDFNLRRNEWPWIVNEQEEWDYCPSTGGFNFRAFTPIRNVQICPDEWTPNRMESECILGEGFRITYPSTQCSPFDEKNTTLNVICWASWTEGDYLFVIAGQPGTLPQFSFRLDKRMTDEVTNYTGPTTLVSHMYFSPVTPISSNGLNQYSRNGNIQQLKLNMQRGDAGICYDESEKCGKYATEGHCSTGHGILQEGANHCKRSCGMCNFLPTFREECHFGDDIQGEWVWYEKDRKESVQVSGGFIGFSRIGGFVCKGKHWDQTDYKLFSYYKNGCRPRYTCMRMLPLLDDHKILFQLSKSTLTDLSFSMCENFEDDPLPIGDAVRSKLPKLLIPQRQTKANTCGLKGLIHVTMTTGVRSHKKTCHGTVSDWNSQSCGMYSTLTVKLQGKCSVADPMSLLYEEEFICDSYIALEEDYSLLITRSMRGKEEYSCWIIKTYAERMSYRPWRHAYLLDRAQCGRASDFDLSVLNTSKLVLDVDNENLNRPCVNLRPPYTGSKPTVIHFPPKTDSGSYDVNPQSNLQQSGTSSRMWYSFTVHLLSLISYYYMTDITAHDQHVL